MAEVLNRVIMQAKRNSAPAQINVPRDYFTQVVDIALPAIDFERPAGGAEALDRAARLLSNARFPILNGAGVVLGGHHFGVASAGRTAFGGLLRLPTRARSPVRTRCTPGRWVTTGPRREWN